MQRPGRMIRQVLESLFQKAATTQYPFVKARMPKEFRGQIRCTPEKCVGCKACMRDCPAGAITIRKVGDKKFEAEIDTARCIFCGQCVDSCPRQALEVTGEFELAQRDPARLKVVFHAEEKREASVR
jgi:formate hydrogenlyase subunit 6/NADH:ubiquinone oxidoreductase subunit I